MIKFPFLLLLCIYSSLCFSQNYSADAKAFFKQFKSVGEVNKYCLGHLPSLNDCKYVLKGNSAYAYYAKIDELKDSISHLEKINSGFREIKVVSYSTSEIICKNGDAAKGVKAKDVFQSDVILYEVSFLENAGDVSGTSFKYFVNIKGVWYMFPKPMTVLYGN